MPIPKKLKIVLREAITLTRKNFKGKVVEELKARPAFYCNGDSKKSLDTALSWGNEEHWGGHPERGGVGWIKRAPATVLEIENEPFSDLKLWSLEQRGEGGRAYKVTTGEGHYVDLREDVVVDILLSRGCGRSGALKGKFIWVRNGSQMRIARVGSALHKRMVEETKAYENKDTAARKKRIPAKDLVIGGVYPYGWGASYGDLYVYLGRVRHKGSKKYLWRSVPWAKNLEDVQKQFPMHPRWSSQRVNLVVSSSLPLAQYPSIGKINIDGYEAACAWEYVNGHGTRIPTEEVEVLKE